MAKYRDMTPEQKMRHNGRVLEWQRKHPDKVKLYQQNSRTAAKWKDDFKDQDPPLLNKFEFYCEVLMQGGLCKVCGEKPKRLFTYIDPKEKKFRGLVCLACRRGLDAFGDSATKLFAAAQFLRAPLNHRTNPPPKPPDETDEDPGP